MKFKIIETTGDFYESEVVTTDGGMEVGDKLHYKDVVYTISDIVWVSPTVVKVACSNFIAVLKLIG